ncbi:hypothetical protein RUM43_001145 [Polyplax serrata]|uniref:Uncharacterized protein n=1 Tax=Polyplax serrata TaxID=468196 RepID=A0AAN8SH83_POLSC
MVDETMKNSEFKVRRLSERGGEGSGPSPIEQAFLATLSQAPAPMPGTRRHSVVTISRAPYLPPLFGRNRRESIAAFATGIPGLPLRRDSVVSQTRGSLTSVNSSGSSFNLHLDIMDDITEAKARAKEKRKMSRTQSKDLTEETDSTNSNNLIGQSNQKNFVAQGKKGVESDSSVAGTSSTKKTGPGIVCTNTDLISILSPLTSSAQEICGAAEREKDVPHIITNPNTGSPTQQKTILERKRRLFKDRSNSFDVGTLPGNSTGPASWFVKRHQPIAKKDEMQKEKSQVVVTFTDEKQKVHSSLVNKPEKTGKTGGAKGTDAQTSPTSEPSNRVVWDNRSGSVVDPQVFGSAIEVFLNQKTSHEPTSPVTKSPLNAKDSPPVTASSMSSKTWFGPDNPEAVGESSSDTCDTSICSTLKDLFVK